MSIQNGPCLSWVGMGNADNPFLGTPIVDPAASNMLECGAEGLLVPHPDIPGLLKEYAVEWRSAGSEQPVLNDGDSFGFYRHRGQVVDVYIMIRFGHQTTLGAMGSPWQLTLPSHLPPLIYATLGAEVGGFACVAEAINGIPLIDKILMAFNPFWDTHGDGTTGKPDWAGPNIRDVDGTDVEQPWPAGTRIVVSGSYPTEVTGVA